MTSVALLELLFENVWHVRPEFVPGDAEIADIARFGDDPHDARLVIGDAALRIGALAADGVLDQRAAGAKVARSTDLFYRHQYDLGVEWKAWTGLPFVFAVWVAQRTAPVGDALRTHASLMASRDWGLAHLGELAQQASWATGVSEPVCLSYLSGLDYGLSYPHLAGLTEFYRRLVAAGRVPNGTLSFLPAA